MTDYRVVHEIDFLPELKSLGLRDKAAVIQALLKESFFHPSGLFYSLLLIDGPHHVRPMARADLLGTSDTASEGCYADGGTSEAAKDEGMTFENSIYSAGLYLQAQAARYQVTGDPAAHAEGARALNALRLIYDHGRARGKAGWLGKPYGLVPRDHSTPDQYHAAVLGLYRFRAIAAPHERELIDAMLRDIADFLPTRNYQCWNATASTEPPLWSVKITYHNVTYVLLQAIAYRITGEEKYRTEALRLVTLSNWREESLLEEWQRRGLERVLQFEIVCWGAFILQAADVIYEILPEAFGDTPEAAAASFRDALDRWWRYSQLGIDAHGYQHYWIDIDVAKKGWHPTGLRPIEHPPLPGTFFAYYSDVRWSDSLYRTVTGALPVMAHLPDTRNVTLGWASDILRNTGGQRLRWMIDLDGRQLKPDVKWMGCMLSSEAPFHFLIAYWRGRALGYWA